MYGLLYDLVIFHVSFNSITWAGIIIVCTAFIFNVYMILKQNRDKELQEKNEKEQAD